MSVNKSDRRESKVEFDNIYFKVYDDAIKIIQNKFGAKDVEAERTGYINYMASSIMKSVTDMGTYRDSTQSIRCTRGLTVISG